MGLFGFFGGNKQREEEERAYMEEQERLRRQQEMQSQGPPKDLIIKTDLVYKLNGPIYKVKFINNSKDPMGELEVNVLVDKKLGIAVESTMKKEMLDPDEEILFEFKIVPTLNLGAGTIKSMTGYFDFQQQSKRNFNMKVRNIQVSCPQVQPFKVDDNMWRIKMSNLEKFEIESNEFEAHPPTLFQDLCQSAEKSGFFGVDPFVVPTLYRGLRKYIGTVGEEILAVQVQVIGQDDTSKFLIECYASNAQKAMGVAEHSKHNILSGTWMCHPVL
jgi:hypothetical protein